MFLQNHRWVKTELFLILQCVCLFLFLSCHDSALELCLGFVLRYLSWSPLSRMKIADYPGFGCHKICWTCPQVSLKNIRICHGKMDGNIHWCDSSCSRLLGNLVHHKKYIYISFPSTPLRGSQLITIKCRHDMPCSVQMSTFEPSAVCRNINCYIISWGLGWVLTLITVLI